MWEVEGNRAAMEMSVKGEEFPVIIQKAFRIIIQLNVVVWSAEHVFF